MSYYHNVLIESTVQYSTVQYSTVQYSTGSWYLFVDIIMLTGDARIRFDFKKKPFCVILLCGHYHGIITMDTEISLYCELENSVC